MAEDSDFYVRLVAEHSRDSIMVMDAGGIVRWVNKGCEQVSGFRAEEMIGRKPDELFGVRPTSISGAELMRRTIETRRTQTVQRHNARPDGTLYWLETAATPVYDRASRISHIVTVARDITERRALEESAAAMMRAERMRRRERQLLSRMSEWLYAVKSFDELLDVIGASIEALFPGSRGQLYIYSDGRETLEAARCWGAAETSPRNSHGHVDPDDCWALRRGRAYAYGSAEIEFPCAHVEGDDPYFCMPIVAHGDTIGLMHLSHPARSVEGAPTGAEGDGRPPEAPPPHWDLALLCAEQISLAIANVRLRQELQEKSVRDPLTGLWNRRWFLETAERALAEAQRRGTPLSLISLDVDRFKRFNDLHGHAAGDEVLRAVGAMLDAAEGTSACRIGGEEFVLLCPGMTEAEASATAEAVRAALADMVVRSEDAELPRVSVSAGVAQAPRDRRVDLGALMRAADTALYAAKDAGRDRVIRASVPRPAVVMRAG